MRATVQRWARVDRSTERWTASGNNEAKPGEVAAPCHLSPHEQQLLARVAKRLELTRRARNITFSRCVFIDETAVT